MRTASWPRSLESNSFHSFSIRHQLPKACRRKVLPSDTSRARAAPPGDAFRSSSDEQHPEVQKALSRVHESFKTAESSFQNLHKLPSNRQPTSTGQFQAMKAIRRLVTVAAVVGGLPATQLFGFHWQVLLATLGGMAFAGFGYRKGSLSESGAIAACLVGAATLSTSLRIGFALLGFYYTSSKLTAFKEEVKDVDEHFKKGGQRDWRQVLCNGGIPSCLALWYGCLTGCMDIPFSSEVRLWPTALLGAAVGYYASCCADTWASELGQLSEDTPVLITSLRRVRKGTNGGVTKLGLMASVGGGLLVGVAAYAGGLVAPTLRSVPGAFGATAHQWQIIPIGLVAGLFGSLMDSFLGATVQFTGYNRTSRKLTSKPGPDVTHISGTVLLTNNAVNLVSAALTSCVMAAICIAVF